ncbi:DNA-binding transcriptional regulator [Pontiella sp. NLcol2]|uniref:DNA-binding transcriptional regulator n=2 Tax=Pontiella agarivorans TaxID=3038953 RepID=A0ABU5MXC3_9BACT|nr:DNA-binding transcriptional regulator [Pontiella agarivorans]
MKTESRILNVAILLNAKLDWGRNIMNGILAYAQEVGPWKVWIRRDAPNQFNHLPENWEGDGVIARVSSETLAKELTEHGIPYVNVDDNPLPNLPAPSFLTDDKAGTEMAAEFFIEKGFRTIALVGSIQKPTNLHYINSFKQALSNHNMPCHFFEITPNWTDAQPKLCAWLQQLPKPAGLLCLGINGTSRIVNLCNDLGISVPHDIAILASNDDQIGCHSCFPPLSGIISPTEQIGYRAAEKLHRLMLGEPMKPETFYIPPPSIVERLSTDTLAVKDPRLVKAMQFIKKHAFEPITMNDILKVVPMSRRSLERRFSEVFKHTPNNEIRRLRMNRAKELLAETDLPMADIAEACGYSSYNYLSHAFRNATGISPSAYRKQFR